MKTLFLLISLFFSLASSGGNAQAQPADAGKQEAVRFVQDFYGWYDAKNRQVEARVITDTPFAMALREKAAAFDPSLLAMLKEDLAASAKSPAEIVGLDFDPFLNTQDPLEKYIVGEAAPQEDGGWRVEVFGSRGGKKMPDPSVIVQLARRDGRLVFANFHYQKSIYPQNEDLARLLNALKKGRETRRK